MAGNADTTDKPSPPATAGSAGNASRSRRRPSVRWPRPKRAGRPPRPTPSPRPRNCRARKARSRRAMATGRTRASPRIFELTCLNPNALPPSGRLTLVREYVPIRQNKCLPGQGPLSGQPWRRRFSALLPWIFIVGVVAATMLPLRQWLNWPVSTTSPLSPHEIQAARDAETVWKRAGNASVRHPVDVIRTIDGDTFEARVHLSPGLEPTTRVRLRGIDAPELKAACAAGTADGRSRRRSLARAARRRRGHDLQYRPRQICRPRRCRCRDAADRQCFGGAARRGSCARLSRRPPRRLVLRLISPNRKAALLRGFLFFKSCVEAVGISGSRPPSCRRRRADRGR